MCPVGLAIGALLAMPPAARGAADFYSSINYYQDGGYVSVSADGSDESQVNYQSFLGGVGSGWTVRNGESFALAGGYADAADMNMGVFAQVVSTPNNNHLSDARISTEAANRLMVSPGSSGLAIGDVTTLTLKIKMDGSLHGEATSWPGKGWSHAEMSAGLSVHDYGIQIDLGPDGFYSPALASFGASCELEAYDVYLPYWQYSYWAGWDESWSAGSNSSPEFYHDDSWGGKETDEAFHYQAGHYFNTGEQTLTFEAIVGHTLDFNADLYVYIDACNDAQTWVDFANTFAIDVTPAVNGVSLNWQVVPEPTAMLLLAAGSLFLRRKR